MKSPKNLYLLILLSLFVESAFATDDHLLLCEAVVTPTSHEFIEIANPTVSPVSLDDYYVSDDADYALLPGASAGSPAPAIGSSDFISQFPAGATIPAMGVITVAFDGAGFLAAFGATADFEIHGTDAGTPDMIGTNVGVTAGLTNSGENAVLFRWDGVSDLVTDVDMLNIGTPSAANTIADKTLLTVDGPDGDTVASSYAADAYTMPQQASDPGSGFSTKRISVEAGREATGGGNGLTGDDETSENITTTWDTIFTAPTPGACSLTPSAPVIFINEVDADTDGTDTLEFVELYGDPNTPLDGLVLVFFNGNGAVSYNAFDLDGFSLDAGGFFVLGNVAVANVDLVFDNTSLQNGPDAVALFLGNAADFPSGTPVTDAELIDALVYDTDDADAAGLIAALTPGQPQIDEHSGGNGTFHSNSRLPDGGIWRDTSTYVQQDPTPGASNLGLVPPTVVINEVDADTAGTDTLEFVELYDGGVGNTDLSGLVLVFFNGSDDASYTPFGFTDSIDLDGYSTDVNGYFVVGNAAVANIDVVFGDGVLQNGPDAVALFTGDGADFPNDTPVSNTNLIDAIVYDTDDGDDAALISVLTPGQPQINERDGGDGTSHSSQRCPDGGAALDTSTYTQATPTPGAANNCGGGVVAVLINEVDADTDGTDILEFVELYDGGVGNTDLSGLVLVFFNGSDDASYTPGGFTDSIDLDGFSTNMNGYFVAGNAAVANVDVVFGGNGLQNGADAVALITGDGTDFPNDTPVTNTNLIDAVVYDTDDGDDAGLISVLTPGQPQIDERGGGDGAFHSNQRCLDGGIALDTSTYTQATPTPGAANNCGVPPVGGPSVMAEIFEIQGNGAVSPFAGLSVTSNDNIVTAVSTDGFAMQTPDARADADPETSQGIYVFTGSAPTVAVGDQVDVTGDVVEFFDFTELTNNPVVSIDSSGNTLPTAVILDANTPSPLPGSPSCTADSLECFEGMLVQISGIVTGPSQNFGSDPIAEAKILAGNILAFRESGIEFPGMAGLPVWDGNPEIFELDPDRLGLANRSFNVGVTFEATGVIGYEFGDYELWPNSYTVTQEVPLPVAVRAPVSGEMTVGSLNMYRFFDDVPADYAIRRAKLVAYIRDVLGNPDILAVQEAESLTVLNDLAADILADSGVAYTAQLIEGNDIGSIDVGFLVRDTVSINAVTQLGAAEIFTFDNSLLHDRPPLLLEAAYNGNGMAFDLAVMVIHGRSLNNIDDPSDGDRVRQKRLQQSQSVAQKAQDFQGANPSTPLVVVGDFNAFEFSDGYVDVVGQMQGVAVPGDNLLSGPNLVIPPLVNQVLSLPAADRYSFNFRGSLQVLDHALTSTAATPWVRGFEFGRANAGGPGIEDDNDTNAIRSSDHDGFVLFLMTDFDADTVPDDLDNCPLDANTNQSDIDMDNMGDVCDSCDSAAAPVFTVTEQTATQVSGTVSQCAGVFMVTLDPAASNVTLTTAGVPGDSVWTFVVALDNPGMPGSVSISANGTTASSRSALFSLATLAVPSMNLYGLLLMILIIMIIGLSYTARMPHRIE